MKLKFATKMALYMGGLAFILLGIGFAFIFGWYGWFVAGICGIIIGASVWAATNTWDKE